MAKKIASTTVTKNGNVKVEGYKPMNGGAWITKERRLAIYMRDGFCCMYCGTDLQKLTDPKGMSLDHLMPRVLGGNNESSNLITVCRSCNSSRNDKPWQSYATGGAIERILEQIGKPVNVKLAKAVIAGRAKNDELEALR